jgi:predicted negative regulator of RcsB-dependent stress response
MDEMFELVGKWGGLVIMAGLFVWTYLQDKTKNANLLKELAKTNEDNARAIEALVESNKNIATSLELLKNGMNKLDEKADRNHDAVLQNCKGCCYTENASK